MYKFNSTCTSAPASFASLKGLAALAFKPVSVALSDMKMVHVQVCLASSGVGVAAKHPWLTRDRTWIVLEGGTSCVE